MLQYKGFSHIFAFFTPVECITEFQILIWERKFMQCVHVQSALLVSDIV
jgi:hypothetical protein